MNVTIKKIAEMAEVSVGTVDRVLHDRPYVKPEIRERVLSLAKELNYVPNQFAKALVSSNKKFRIGLVNTGWVQQFSDEIFKGIAAAEKELYGYGVSLIVKTVGNIDPSECINALDALVKKKVDGIAISAMNNPIITEKVDEIVAQGIPVVTFNSDLPESKRLCFVGQDLYKSGKVAAGLVAQCVEDNGQILITLANYEFEAHKARVYGFIDRLKEIDKPLTVVDIVQTFDNYQKTYDVIASSLNRYPDVRGIYMAAEDVLGCVDAVDAFYKLNSVAKKIHIVCNDLLPYTKILFEKGKIDFTLDQDPYSQGYQSIKILFDYLFAKKSPESELLHTDISIYIKESL